MRKYNELTMKEQDIEDTAFFGIYTAGMIIIILVGTLLGITSANAYTPSWYLTREQAMTNEQMIKATQPNKEIFIQRDIIKTERDKPFSRTPTVITTTPQQLASATFLKSYHTCRTYGKIGVNNPCQIIKKKNKDGWLYYAIKIETDTKKM
jgi:hypothetical protein